jgi:hypothetical protein
LQSFRNINQLELIVVAAAPLFSRGDTQVLNVDFKTQFSTLVAVENKDPLEAVDEAVERE